MASSIPYSGGTVVNTTFLGDTRQHIVDGIVAALQSGETNAGWTVASGSGADITLQSGADSGSRQIRVRLYEPGAGNCAQVFLKNVAETRTSQAFFLLPGVAKTYRIIGSKFGFVCFTEGSSPAREFVFCTMLFVPSGITINSNCAFMNGNGAGDADGSLKVCVRTSLGIASNGDGYASYLVGETLWNVASSFIGTDAWRFPNVNDSISQFHSPLWHDGSVIVTDAMLAFGLSNPGEVRVRGIPFNCFLRMDSVAGDTTFTYDGHTFYVLTNSYPNGTLCIAAT